MALTQNEFEALINDAQKAIDGDIQWAEDDDHSPSVEFRADVQTTQGDPLIVRGSFNALAGTLSYVLLHRGSGRIYALDMGKDHRNPSTGQLVGEIHKHRWSEAFRDKEAYVPPDITAPSTRPVEVWAQFCAEARIVHNGTLQAPPQAVQQEIFI